MDWMFLEIFSEWYLCLSWLCVWIYSIMWCLLSFNNGISMRLLGMADVVFHIFRISESKSCSFSPKLPSLKIKRFPQLDTKVITNAHFFFALHTGITTSAGNWYYFLACFADTKLRSRILKQFLRAKEVGLNQKRHLDAGKLIYSILNL